MKPEAQKRICILMVALSVSVIGACLWVKLGMIHETIKQARYWPKTRIVNNYGYQLEFYDGSLFLVNGGKIHRIKEGEWPDTSSMPSQQ